MSLPDQSLPWPICWSGVQLIAEREGCRLKAYKCPAGRWTCGWGETEGVTPATVWTQPYADQRLADSLAERAHAVRGMCTVPPTDNQLAAMVSLSYNAGLEGFRSSSVLKAHNRGDAQAAGRAFSLWNKARIDGVLQVVPGLTSRRAAETALYLQPEPEQAPHAMPQAVEAETSLARSPTAQAGTVTAAAGAVAALSQAGDQVQVVSSTLQTVKAVATETLGLPAEWFLPAVLILVGAVVIWQRTEQRRQGWA